MGGGHAPSLESSHWLCSDVCVAKTTACQRTQLANVHSNWRQCGLIQNVWLPSYENMMCNLQTGDAARQNMVTMFWSKILKRTRMPWPYSEITIWSDPRIITYSTSHLDSAVDESPFPPRFKSVWEYSSALDSLGLVAVFSHTNRPIETHLNRLISLYRNWFEPQKDNRLYLSLTALNVFEWQPNTASRLWIAEHCRMQNSGVTRKQLPTYFLKCLTQPSIYSHPNTPKQLKDDHNK